MTPISEQPLLKAQVLAKLLGLAGGVGEAKLQQPAATDLWELHPRVGDYLFELNQTGAIHYEEVGEEAFAPIVICMTTADTLQHLAESLVEARKDKAAVEQRLQSLLRHDRIVSSRRSLSRSNTFRRRAPNWERIRFLLR